MIQGTLLLFSTCMQALFDSGASHSFIFAASVSALGLEIESLRNSMTIASPLEGKIPVNLTCRGCEIRVTNIQLTYDLCVIEMTDYDVIMGIDWLSTPRAVID